jgi:nucleoside-diphosphate-sugar epimerase
MSAHLNGSSAWQTLREEAGLFPWKGVLLRMAADFVLVNAAMLSAFLLWFLFYTVGVQLAESRTLARHFRSFVATYWLFWSFLALLVFLLSGFYTRTRGYASPYKAWVIVRSVSLFVVLFVFADYFLFRGDLVPRGVALVGWALALALVGGSRFAKDIFLRRYQVQPKRRSRRVERVLVVGGAGYLGAVLVPQLVGRGYRVRVLDSFLFGREPLDGVRGRCEMVAGDIRDIQAVVQAMKDCDAVIHLAAIVGDPACEENKSLAAEINRAATRMLVDVARGYGVSRFLFASTCSVYGASDFLMDEHTQLAPLSTYAQTKAESEQILLAARTADFHPTVLRLGTLFGPSPRARFDLVVNLLVARAATTGKISIFNGGQWRPFVHVHDAARAFLAVLEAGVELVSGEVFNVGAYALNHRLSDLGALIGRTVPGAEVAPAENDDRRNYRVSFDKIHTRLGFVCEKTLEDGVRELYAQVASGEAGDIATARFHNHAVVRNLAAAAEPNGVQLLEALSRRE